MYVLMLHAPPPPLVLSGTFSNIVGLVTKDKNHPTYTSEELDDSLVFTVYVKLLLDLYYACTMWLYTLSLLDVWTLYWL